MTIPAIPAIGERAPHFRCRGPEGEVSLDDVAGAPAVILFFQEAGTPDCHRQLAAYVQEGEALAATGARVVAISSDPVDRLADYDTRLMAPFPLLSDPGGEAARRYGVWDEGARRSRRAAFVLDAKGTVRHANPRYSPLRVDDLLAVFEVLDELAAKQPGEESAGRSGEKRDSEAHEHGSLF